jgi:hypothetical protein
MTQLYRHFAADGRLLYVGISVNVIWRIGTHQERSHWFRSISRIEIEHFDSRDAALAAEKTAIRAEKPLFNVQHTSQKVDRSDFKPGRVHARIIRELTAHRHDWPRISKKSGVTERTIENIVSVTVRDPRVSNIQKLLNYFGIDWRTA